MIVSSLMAIISELTFKKTPLRNSSELMKKDIKKKKPYISACVFQFSFKNQDVIQDVIIAGIDFSSVKLVWKNQTNKAYIISDFKKDFKEKYYLTQQFLILFQGEFHSKKKVNRFCPYPLFTILPGQMVKGFLIFPRFSYSIKHAKILIQAFYYKHPWKKEKVLLTVPLKFSVYRAKL